MTPSELPYALQEAVQEVQGLLQDWRAGKVPVVKGSPEDRLLARVETLFLALYTAVLREE